MSSISANASALGDDLRLMRDRVLLALGMGGAFRRFKLVALRFTALKRVLEDSSV